MISRVGVLLACFLSIVTGLGSALASPVLSAGSATVNVGDVVTIPISIAGAAGLPEPATLLLFGAAFSGLAIVRRCQRRQQSQPG
jgi:hypothetical protein